MKKWHCGVRAKTSGKLIAFISAIPSVIRVYNKVGTLRFQCQEAVILPADDLIYSV